MDVQALYSAQTLEEGVSVLLKPMPNWLPLTSAITATALYYGSYRYRMLISKVRNNHRNRILRRQAQEEAAQVAAALQQSETEASEAKKRSALDAQNADGDLTAVTESDVREFCMSLGVQLPRDADLLVFIEQLLYGDPIPQGYVLLRTSGGYLRFQNQNTEELSFFHPGAAEIELKVRSELRKRYEAECAGAVHEVTHNEQLNKTEEKSELEQQQQLQASSGAAAGVQGSINWEEVDDEDDKPSKGFQSVLNWFVEREKAKIEAEMAAKRKPKVEGGASKRRGLSSASMRVTLSKAPAPQPEAASPAPTSGAPVAASPSPASSPTRSLPPVVPKLSSRSLLNDDSLVVNSRRAVSPDAIYTPAGLPPVPKYVPTPRSRRGSPTSSMERTSSNLTASGSIPRAPSWRAKSPSNSGVFTAPQASQ